MPYLSDTELQVAFGFFDTVGLMGNELMTAVFLMHGYKNAAELFDGISPKTRIKEWYAHAESIKNNLDILFNKEGGYHVSDTVSCRQFNAWGNGLM